MGISSGANAGSLLKSIDASEGPSDPHSLVSQALFFVRHASPLLLVVNASLALTTRVLVAVPFTWADLVLAAFVTALWPAQEWTLHRYVLHLKPRKLFGVTFDPLFAQAHRAHHRRPWLVEKTLLPTPLLVVLIPLQAVWLLPFESLGLGLTALATYAVMAVLYEWTHYLTHAAYAPKGAYYKRIWRNHRLHHFKNENAWFAFTSPHIDGVLGTDPRLEDTETSATVRTLGVDDEEEEH